MSYIGGGPYYAETCPACGDLSCVRRNHVEWPL